MRPEARHPLFQPFTSLMDFLEEVDQSLFLSIHAIRSIEGLGRLSEVLAKATDEIDSETISQDKEIEFMAKKEIEQGFPLLIAHSIVASWAALEATMSKFIILWLRASPHLFSNGPLSDISVQAKYFNFLEPAEFMQQILEQLERKTAANLKPGIGRFEAVLSVVGLGGGFDDTLRRDLFEMSKVRNLIVHKFSHVDSVFKTSCPWLDVKIGDRLKLSTKDYRRYHSAIRQYAAEIIERLMIAHPKNPLVRK